MPSIGTAFGRRHYQCDVCGRIGPWMKDWTWYGSYRDLKGYTVNGKYFEPKGVLMFCSRACVEKERATNLELPPFEVIRDL